MSTEENREEELMSTEKNAIPAPPPLPPTTSYAQKRFPISKSHRFSNDAQHGALKAAARETWDRLFDEAYKADVVVHTDAGGKIFAHAGILGTASPVMKNMLNQSKRGKDRRRSITIRGVPHDAVRVFIRFLYSSCFDPAEMEEFVLHLLVLSHTLVVPHLKRECERRLEDGMLNIENVVDIFQLALLCDASRIGHVCHRMILRNFKAVSETDGWKAMKQAHPILEKQILQSLSESKMMEKMIARKREERKMYIQLYEAMEALVHICKDGCRTIGPHDKAFEGDHARPCRFPACKGIEHLVRHFAGCKARVSGGCSHCKRMWKLLELHSRLCVVDSGTCKVPLCDNFKRRSRKQKKKEDMKWRILAKKIVRSKSISGAPYFSIAA